MEKVTRSVLLKIIMIASISAHKVIIQKNANPCKRIWLFKAIYSYFKIRNKRIMLIPRQVIRSAKEKLFERFVVVLSIVSAARTKRSP